MVLRSLMTSRTLVESSDWAATPKSSSHNFFTAADSYMKKNFLPFSISTISMQFRKAAGGIVAEGKGKGREGEEKGKRKRGEMVR